MGRQSGSQTIEQWPDESREAAQLVIDQYGEPHEATESMLLWHQVGPWKRVIAQREFCSHEFPTPHIDAVAGVINYRVPPDRVTPLAEFDGSVVVERTAGEVLARCHDEQANFLALNLMHDVVTGQKTVEDARQYYAKEFLDYRRGNPTPYMEKLHFEPADESAADPDTAVLSEQDLQKASEEGS